MVDADAVLGQPAGQVQPLEHELDRGGHLAGRDVVLADAEPVEHRRQAGHGAELGEQLVGRHERAGLDDVALGEVLGEAVQVDAGQPVAVGRGDRQPVEVAEHLVLAALLAHLELDLAAQRDENAGQVADPGHRVLLADERAAAQRGGGRAPRRRRRRTGPRRRSAGRCSTTRAARR